MSAFCQQYRGHARLPPWRPRTGRETWASNAPAAPKPGPPPHPVRWSLMLIRTVLQGPDKGRKFELPDHEPQLIGRSSEALPLTDNTVSRRHAELTPDDGVWWIRDLHSQNGTYVN